MGPSFSQPVFGTLPFEFDSINILETENTYKLPLRELSFSKGRSLLALLPKIP